MKMYLPPPGAKTSRRGFLKRGLFGGLLLAIGGAAWLASRKSAVVPAPPGLKVLSEREHAVMVAICARVVPPRAGWPAGVSLELGRVCDSFLAAADQTVQTDVKRALMLFENALTGFVFGFHTAPFTTLSPAEQDAVLHEWATSVVALRRTAFLALRTLAAAAYFVHRESWPAIGYPGPPPNIHQPDAPVWKGGGAPRPPSNGVFVEPPAEAAP